jgi:hypothetical protein
MRTETLARDRRRRFSDAFDAAALALLPGPQRALLFAWLKGKAQTRRWDTLLEVAGKEQIAVEAAEALACTLAECGAATLEEHFERSVWKLAALVWRDYEALCAALGLKTQAVQRTAFSIVWSEAQQIEWQHAALSDACRALREAPPDRGQARLQLLIRLNDWLIAGRSGTRREFSLFARGQTKQITAAEWAWLAEIVELEDCGVERHAPALWLAGEAQLRFDQRWLDIGAAGDFIALTPSTLDGLTDGRTSATHYRLVENRTSFERVVRAASTAEIVLWLPGYAPTWWRAAVGRLIDAIPLPARISCDADPDGAQIALNAGRLWTARGLAWEPFAMLAEDAAGSRHQLPLTERDR